MHADERVNSDTKVTKQMNRKQQQKKSKWFRNRFIRDVNREAYVCTVNSV